VAQNNFVPASNPGRLKTTPSRRQPWVTQDPQPILGSPRQLRLRMQPRVAQDNSVPAGNLRRSKTTSTPQVPQPTLGGTRQPRLSRKSWAAGSMTLRGGIYLAVGRCAQGEKVPTSQSMCAGSANLRGGIFWVEGRRVQDKKVPAIQTLRLLVA
jgi:hypothetical protein